MLLAVFVISIFFVFKIWQQNRIVIDAPSYYAYLPSAFIYDDLTLHYVDKNPEFFKDKIWFTTLNDGTRIIKHTAGVSVLLAPFFFIGHILAPLFDSPQDGYSMPYQNAVSMGVLIYFFSGLFFLRKTLLKFFTDKVVALSLIAIVAGTNILYYISFEGLMTHGMSFSILCFCLYVFLRWIETGNKKFVIGFSIAFGLLILVRPLSVILLSYFLILGMMMKGGSRNFLSFLKENISVVFVCAGIVLLIFLPQLLYWKCISGNWFVDVYEGSTEQFYFNHPQVIPFLLSFNKGWLIYTPVMWFAIIGLWQFYKTHRVFFYATVVSLSLSIFFYSSWWAWNYGICWGERPMIDLYGLLSFPMAALFSFLFEQKKVFSFLTVILVSALIALNLFQTWQYKTGLIHFDAMTRQAYFKDFFRTEKSNEWLDCLRPYDWDRYRKGLAQIEYSKEYFENIKPTDFIYWRGSNLKFLSASEQSQFIVTSNLSEVGNEELFQMYYLSGDTIALQSNNHKYLSSKTEMRGILIADAGSIGPCEKFILKMIDNNDNRFTLKACNGNYISVSEKFPNIVGAIANKVGTNELFRLYLVEK